MNSHQRALAIVRQVHAINLDGNIIPHAWYKHLTYDTGKPNIVAITLLGEIVYWYRPVVEKDEATGAILGMRKKFRGAKFQRNHNQFADQFGFTKRQVISGIDYLKARGLITTEVVKREIIDGHVYGNRLYIEIMPDALAAITMLDAPDDLSPPPSIHTGIEGSADSASASKTGDSIEQIPLCAPPSVHTRIEGQPDPAPLSTSMYRGSDHPCIDPLYMDDQTLTETLNGDSSSDPEEGEGQADATERQQFFEAEGITQRVSLRDVPLTILRAAAADVEVPRGHKHRPGRIVMRCKQWKRGQWQPPALPRVRSTALSGDGSPVLERAVGAVDSSLMRLWADAQPRLLAAVDSDQYTTWLADATLLDLDGDQAIVGAPNVFARDHIDQHYAPQLAAALGVARVEIVIGG